MMMMLLKTWRNRALPSVTRDFGRQIVRDVPTKDYDKIGKPSLRTIFVPQFEPSWWIDLQGEKKKWFRPSTNGSAKWLASNNWLAGWSNNKVDGACENVCRSIVKSLISWTVSVHSNADAIGWNKKYCTVSWFGDDVGSEGPLLTCCSSNALDNAKKLRH